MTGSNGSAAAAAPGAAPGTSRAAGFAAGLKPYPAMKDSGVPWLGEVPEHWEAASVKRHYAIQLGKMLQNRPEGPADAEVAYLKAQHVQWFSVRTASPPKMWASPRDITQFGIAAGDLLVCEGGEGGRSGIVGDIPSGLIIQNALHRVRPHGGCLNGYLQYVMSAVSATGWFDAINNKATIAHFTREKFGALGMPVPSRDEQAAIVRFLDHADRRIRRYIRAKQKLIKLLEEQKQAIIHRAVTRGLDSNVRLKPSGVEWLGDVPEHWEVQRLKDVASVQTGMTLGKAYLGSLTKSYPYLRVANVQVGRVDLKHVKHIDVPEREAAGAMLRAGDVLMTEGGDIDKLGRGCVWHAEIPVCLHQNHVFAVRCDRALLLPDFLVGLMASQHGRTYFQLTAKQTTNLAATNSTTLRAFPILRPPMHEQQAIIDDIARQTVVVSRAVEDAQREISLLREYRTRLIADVVTGKLDVREAAARLPPEAEDLEPLDEAEAESEAHEADAGDGDGVPEEAET